MESMETSTDRGMTSNASEQMTSEMQELKQSFGQLRDDVVNLFTHAFGWGRSGAEVARDYGADAMEGLKARLDRLRDKGAVQMRSVERKIEAHPLSTTMLAFGIGFCAAAFMIRRRVRHDE